MEKRVPAGFSSNIAALAQRLEQIQSEIAFHQSSITIMRQKEELIIAHIHKQLQLSFLPTESESN